MDLDYQTFFRELNRKKIDYLVVGGLAVNFHGVPRMTYDIDLMILLEPQNILSFVDQLVIWGYQPKIPVDPKNLADDDKRTAWIREKNMMAFNFYNEEQTLREIDLVISSPIPYSELKETAIIVQLQEENIPVVSMNNLVKLKRHAGRKQDLSDIEALSKIMEI
jgi:hypothetical protein